MNDTMLPKRCRNLGGVRDLSCLRAGTVLGVLGFFLLNSGYGFGQVGVSGSSQLSPGSGVRTTEYNSEWVESSSPLPGGGLVTTTHFPSTGQTLTTIREPAPSFGTAQPQMGSGNVGYAPIPTGTGGYLVPTVSYVPMSGAAMPANYTVAAAPAMNQSGYSCANCQTMMTQPMAYQPGMMQQVPFASQPPVLPPTAGGVYAPIQSQMGFQPAPGFYAQPQMQAPVGGQGGYRSLVPRALPAGTYIGQGWLGQPKAFVNDQPFRNFLRYLIVP